MYIVHAICTNYIKGGLAVPKIIIQRLCLTHSTIAISVQLLRTLGQ